jgi:tetratricopeptide (TPR) repeat protein
LLSICGGVLLWRRTRPYLLVGWFWYLGMLVPVIGLVQVGVHAMADRYTYLPQIGLAIGLTWGAKQSLRAWPHHARWQGVVSALLLATLMGCAWRQTSYWRTSETLWRRALDCTPDNFVAHNDLGIILRNQGRVDEAIVHYRQALDLKPNDVQAYVNLSVALYQQGRVDEAIRYLQQAVALKPDFAIAHNNLAMALRSQKQFDEALVHSRKAVELAPTFLEARNNLGILLHQLGQTTEAIAQWREVLRWQPENTPALRQLAVVLASGSEASLRNGPEAVELAERAAKLTGNQDPAVLDILAAAQAEAGQFAEAVKTAQQALALATSQNNAALAESIHVRLKLYQSGTPFRETRQLSDPKPSQP